MLQWHMNVTATFKKALDWGRVCLSNIYTPVCAPMHDNHQCDKNTRDRQSDEDSARLWQLDIFSSRTKICDGSRGRKSRYNQLRFNERTPIL